MLLSAGFMVRAALGSVFTVLLGSLVVVSATSTTADEVRALWVVRTSLTSPQAIATMVANAKANRFNTLLVQVRGRGDAYYQQALEPRPVALASQPAFDPLATVIARAHDAGLRVHAWVNVNLVASVGDMPVAREHVIFRHPEWLMVPRALADELADVDPRSPGYLGRLVRYVRAQPADIEGLYLSPISRGSADYTAGIVRDLVNRYDVDGVHFDYLRYPTDDFDYSRETLTAFRSEVLPDVPQVDRRRYDARVAAGETMLYARAYPIRWRAFRTDRLTALLSQLKDTVKARRPDAIVSAAVGPDPAEAAGRRLQDWRAWVDRNLVDVICPMAYTTDSALFATQIAAAQRVAGSHPVWAGIGAYRLTSAQIADHVQTARRLGGAGVVFFSYDSLIDPARGPDYLAQVVRAAFMQ